MPRMMHASSSSRAFSLFRRAAQVGAVVGVTGWLSLVSTGCDSPPAERHMQWVARDAWDEACAEKAMVETFEVTNPAWKIKGQVYTVDVTAKFRLTDACTSGVPLAGKTYRSLDVVTFEKKGLELSSCVNVKTGEKGWSLPGKESTRCWTGPRLLDDAKKG